MGIRDRPISPASPWQNGYAERLIGTLRRECLDQVVIFGEAHLRRILSAYAAYYNQVRTHLALQKDAPFHRTAQRWAPLSPFRSWPGCITNTPGYDFRKGQVQCPPAQVKVSHTCRALDREIVLSRVINAPQELVFSA
jgi:transposase InsO family protein